MHQPEEFDEGLSLKPLLRTLWGYRRIMGIAIGAFAVVSAVALLAVLLLSPTERLGSLEFRLTFDGAADNKYPNGLTFNSAEIVGTPVLTEVFQANGLEQFGSYQSFRDAVFILQSNPELELLAGEYQARLSDTRLTAVDRSRIEAEFKQKRDALRDPVFTLSLRRSRVFTAMPRATMEKVLRDVLAVWARQSVDQKGATAYNVPVLSRNILQRDVLDSEDYLVAVDRLRVTANRILEAIDKLAKLPGAGIIRTGKDQISLGEIRANVEDIERFQLQPLLGMIRSEGLSKNPQELGRYVSAQLFELKLKRDSAVERIRAAQTALQDYSSQGGSRSTTSRESGGGSGRLGGAGESTTVIPQLGEGFLDRLVQMSTQTQVSDVQYRQKLTDGIIEESQVLASLNQEVSFYDGLDRTLVSRGGGGSAEAATIIKTRAKKALDAVGVALDQTVSLYQDLSAHNLNPSTQLYTTIGPFALQAQRSFTVRTAVLYFGLAMGFAVILIPLGCLGHSGLISKV